MRLWTPDHFKYQFLRQRIDEKERPGFASHHRLCFVEDDPENGFVIADGGQGPGGLEVVVAFTPTGSELGLKPRHRCSARSAAGWQRRRHRITLGQSKDDEKSSKNTRKKQLKRIVVDYVPWHFLYFLPLPQGQGSFRPTFSAARRTACI